MICHSRDTNETFCSEKPSVAIILRYIDKMTGLICTGGYIRSDSERYVRKMRDTAWVISTVIYGETAGDIRLLIR